MQLSTAYKQRLANAARIGASAALVVSSVGGALVQPAFASPLTNVSVTLGDSRPSVNSTDTIAFKLPSGSTTAIARIDIKFCDTPGIFSDTCNAPSGFNISDATTSVAKGFAGNAGTTTGTFTYSTPLLSFQPATPAAETPVTMLHSIAVNDSHGSSVGTKYVRIQTFSDTAGTLPIDSGNGTYALVNNVTVSGTVLETLTFAVNPENSAVACGTGGATVNAQSNDATKIPFGTLAAGTSKIACQHITTTTNAGNGYSVALKEVLGGTAPQGGMCRQTATNCQAEGATNTSITSTDVISDGGGLSSTAAAWSEATTKGLGVNANGTATGSNFNGNATDYKSLFGASGVTLASTTGPTSGDTQNVIFRVDIPGNQTAGSYQNQVEYNVVATY